MDEDVLDMIERVVGYMTSTSAPPKGSPDEWDLETLTNNVRGLFGATLSLKKEDFRRYDELELAVYETVERRWKAKGEELGRDFVVVDEELMAKDQLPITAKVRESVARFLLRQFYLKEIDAHWRDHLTQMDHLKDGIHLRGYGNRDPKLEYKREGHLLFASMMREIDHNVLEKMFMVQLRSPDEIRREAERQRRAAEALQRAAQLKGGGDGETASDSVADVAPDGGAKSGGGDGKGKKPGRNDPCWCGSGKKYKKCHLATDERARA
jgi:preprotein translocase subunit SecA